MLQKDEYDQDITDSLEVLEHLRTHHLQRYRVSAKVTKGDVTVALIYEHHKINVHWHILPTT